jgi:hypothetical protein
METVDMSKGGTWRHGIDITIARVMRVVPYDATESLVRSMIEARRPGDAPADLWHFRVRCWVALWKDGKHLTFAQRHLLTAKREVDGDG